VGHDVYVNDENIFELNMILEPKVFTTHWSLYDETGSVEIIPSTLGDKLAIPPTTMKVGSTYKVVALN
jgi:hypothetical protein